MKLTQITTNQSVILRQVSNQELEVKLLELGFGAGTLFEIVRVAPANGPLLIRNANTQIILRKEDASFVEVELKD